MTRPLTRDERDMLAFERWAATRRPAPGYRQSLMGKLWPRLGPTRYYQVLNQVLTHPEAARVAPDVVRRLGGLRARKYRR